jgi:hypothetical protein
MIEIFKTRDEYFACPALNYSTLKALDASPELLLSMGEFKKGEGMIFGSAVDVLLFDGVEEFDKQFYVFDAKKPTGQLAELADAYLSITNTAKPDAILAMTLADDMKLWANVGNKDKRMAKLTGCFWEYINAMKSSEGKDVITSIDAEKIGIAADSLRTNTFTRECYQQDDNDLEVVYQLAFAFDHKGVRMKCMLDSVVINHETKMVRPVDTKTTGNSGEAFPGAVIKFRYDLQAEVYQAGIKQWVEENHPGYSVDTFYFAVVSSAKPEKAFMYSLMTGDFVHKHNNTRVKKLRGMDELVKLFKWHSSTQQFEYSKEMYEKGSVAL